MKKFIRAARLRSVRLLGWGLFVSFLVACKEQTTDAPTTDVSSARVSKIVWGPDDYQQFTYNDRGQLTRYVSQWTYINDGSGTTKKMTADFEYDPAQHLSRVTFDGGYYTRYYYEGDRLKKAEEYRGNGQLTLTHTYQFGTGISGKAPQLQAVLTEVHDRWEDQPGLLKRTYAYDSQGNLIREELYNRQSGESGFALSTITQYLDYDQRRNGEVLTSAFPYLPHVRMHRNNPGRQVVLGNDGRTIISAQRFTYQYNQQGYPAQKTVQMTTAPSAPVTTATYQYE